MPELPEVETTCRSVAPAVIGAEIRSVRVGKPLRWPLQCEPHTLVGQQISAVRRRGKYLLMDLSEGMLLWHLGMSGSLKCMTAANAAIAPAAAHDHFDLHTSRCLLRLNDPRRFGAVVFASSEDSPITQKLLGHLGPEPLEPTFTPRVLYAGLRGKTAAIKQVLLAGHAVVGVGNIYASEALFLAGIHPARAAGSISLERVTRLHAAIVQVLQQAVAHGGSTLRNYSNAHGQSGFFQEHVRVYDRAGEACSHCGAIIRRLVQGQRATFYCPQCQR